MADPIRVVFVCLGNICRSPLAEGAFTAHVERAGLSARFEIDSAGTGHWHVGERPDPRSVQIAAKMGVDITAQRGRQFTAGDFDRFDYVRAMDRSNLRNLEKLARGPEHRAKLALMLDELGVAERGPAEVPDPYYGGRDGFRHVWDLVDRATAALLERIRRERGL